jgi:hypothetical protein
VPIELTMTASITVKDVLPTMEQAVNEVKRLNKLQAGKECHYFWQTTHWYPQGRSVAETTVP